MPFHNATTTPAPSPKRSIVKRAKKPAPVSIPVKQVSYAAPTPTGPQLQFGGALVDQAWEKEYATKHPTVRGASASPLTITETIANALRPIADASFDPGLILKGPEGAKTHAKCTNYASEVVEGIEIITQAVATLIENLHNGRTGLLDIGATVHPDDKHVTMEASAVERHLSDDLKLAMKQFRIAATGIAEGLDLENGLDALKDITYAAAREAAEEPDVYFGHEEYLDMVLDGYDNMEIEALALDLLERVRPGSMKKLGL